MSGAGRARPPGHNRNRAGHSARVAGTDLSFSSANRNRLKQRVVSTVEPWPLYRLAEALTAGVKHIDCCGCNSVDVTVRRDTGDAAVLDALLFT